MSSFWRSLDLPLINYEIELDLSWSRSCVISKIWRTPAVAAKWNATAETQRTSTIFQINIANLYLPVVNLSANANIKSLENIKQGFKKTISWNKYRSELTT